MNVDAPTTWLFVPGDRPERFEKAHASGADEVILDLEDAVDAEHKESARRAVAQRLAEGRSWVRINSADTRWHSADVAMLREIPGLRGVVLPKAETPADLATLAGALPAATRLMPLVESASGLLRAVDLARSGAAARLAFGSIDFSLDVGCAESEQALLHARCHLVLASRAGGLPPPVDGVTTAVADPAAASAAAGHARSLGFGGKLCIHPAQVEPVAAAFRPTSDEVAWARRVIEASSGGGAVRVDGRMVDRPVLERARRLVAQAES
jgi:citrate lyase subunit beta / citryl-CoA lyase